MIKFVVSSAASTMIERVINACNAPPSRKMLTTRDPSIWQVGDTNRRVTTIQEVGVR